MRKSKVTAAPIESVIERMMQNEESNSTALQQLTESERLYLSRSLGKPDQGSNKADAAMTVLVKEALQHGVGDKIEELITTETARQERKFDLMSQEHQKLIRKQEKMKRLV